GRILRRFVAVLTDEAHRPFVPLWASSSHLAVPLVGMDRVQGILFVRGTEVYTENHLRLLSVVAAQIAAYLTACRLREQEAQIVVDHEAARVAPDPVRPGKVGVLALVAR